MRICSKQFRQLQRRITNNSNNSNKKLSGAIGISNNGRKLDRASNRKLDRAIKGKKIYECHECDKTFTRLDHFRLHQRTHTGEKPFNCAICGKGFAHSSNLKQHQKKYHGEIFTQSSSLKTNQITQTKEIPEAENQKRMDAAISLLCFAGVYIQP